MRLIDADALRIILKHEWLNNNIDIGKYLDIIQCLKLAPTIDAVEVIRCKDCKYYESKCDNPFCYYTENNVETDDYCSFGEKKI